MPKPQLARMERQPPCEIRSRSVFPIADDWMTEESQLNADLMPASGFERKFEQRFVPVSANHAIVRNGYLPTVGDAMNHQRLAFDEIIFECSVCFDGDPLYHSEVPFRNFLPVLLECRLGGFTSSKNYQSGGIAIEPMDDEDLL
jgi:hypothetical protein